MANRSNINFNSIKVRLEPPLVSGGNAFISFQFHKGTIRTKKAAPKGAAQRGFQFHKGTIRTL